MHGRLLTFLGDHTESGTTFIYILTYFYDDDDDDSDDDGHSTITSTTIHVCIYLMPVLLLCYVCRLCDVSDQEPQPCVTDYHRPAHAALPNTDGLKCDTKFMVAGMRQAQTACCGQRNDNCVDGFPSHCSADCAAVVKSLATVCTAETGLHALGHEYTQALAGLQRVCGGGGGH